jgi:two-component system nitrogen regulation sensor histidine kinase NtrY
MVGTLQKQPENWDLPVVHFTGGLKNMAFKNFRIQVIIRLAIIIIGFGFLLYYLIISEKFIRSFYLGIFIAIALIELFYYIDRSNRDIANFFQSILNSDFTGVFTAEKKGKTFWRLYENMNKIIMKFREISTEKEIQYLYLQTLVEQANVGLLSFTGKGEIRLINIAFRQLLDLRPIATNSFISDLPDEIGELLTKLTPGKRKLATLKVRGKMTPLVFIATRIKTKEENFTLISVQNIHRELDEKELESWQKLIRVLTHEIMNSATPITSLSSSLFELVQGREEEPLTEKEKQRIVTGLEAIHDRSSGLMRFTQAYQALTRIPQPRVESITIDDVMHRLEVLGKAQLEDKAIALHMATSDDMQSIKADINLLDQVFLNLVTNSIEALRGRQNPTIKIHFSNTDDGKTMIRFMDNGVGMTEDIREQIFVPFFTTRKNGSGIGLSLCKQIIRLHGGLLGVESVKNQGTSFTIIL